MDKAGGRKLAQCECGSARTQPPIANTASARLLTGDMTIKHTAAMPTNWAAVLGLSTKRDWAYIWFFFVFGLASSKPL